MVATDSKLPEGDDPRGGPPSERRGSLMVDPKLASEEDAAVLAKMGYKQELRRNFSMIEVFGIAFAIMGLLLRSRVPCRSPSRRGPSGWSGGGSWLPCSSSSLGWPWPIWDRACLQVEVSYTVHVEITQTQADTLPLLRIVLLDSLLRFTKLEKHAELLGRIQQYSWTRRRSLFN